MIGKRLNAVDTYYGEVSISQSETGLSVNRTIAERVIQGTASIAHATSDHTPVLRMRFSEEGQDYEETCLIASDLDNYARITCYLYLPGVKTMNPGMEAFFIKPHLRE